MCVVNTVPARVTSSAVSKSRPGPSSATVSSRIRSRPRKPAWPSLVWKTSGASAPVIREYARSARTPPIPSRSSWRRRCSVVPPYSRSVTSRSGRGLSSTSVSSRSSGTRPTWATKMRAASSCSPGTVIRTWAALPSRLAQQRDRQAVGVEHRVGLLLPALAGERLAEVAVAVEQADADQGDAEVARRLEVVTREDPEPAGVLRQHRGDAVLRREVGDRLGQRRPPSADSAEVRWNQRSPVRYCSRSAWASSSICRKLLSAASSARRAGVTAPSVLTGSCPLLRHTSGSSAAKTSCVSGFHDHLRLVARSPRARNGSGSTGRTVKRRMARTGER